jgi:1-acyl-sn-glycerol-3-phosphate acyltransferase
MMDAWIIGKLFNRRLFFMAKATFFSTPLKRWFLGSIGLIPINRTTELKTKGVSNKNSFEMCYNILEQGNVLVIFPEGNSFLERKLRDLKSGTARIAMEVVTRGKTRSELKIIPVGLVYSKAEKFRSSVFANVGKPINPYKYIEEYNVSSVQASKELTDEFRNSLENLLVSSSSTANEILVDNIIEVLSSKYTRTKERGVEKNVIRIKEINERINEIVRIDSPRIEEIRILTERIKNKLKKLDIKPDFLDRSYRPRMFARQILQSLLFLVIGLPLFWYGLIHNIFQYKLIDIIITKLVKDLEYYAAIAVLMGIFLYPLTYFGFIELVDYFIPLAFIVKLIYFASMPLLGLFAFSFQKYIGHISFKTNYLFLMKTERESINTLRMEREKLRQLIFD